MSDTMTKAEAVAMCDKMWRQLVMLYDFSGALSVLSTAESYGIKVQQELVEHVLQSERDKALALELALR